MNVFNLRPKHLQGVEIVFADPPYRGGYAQRLVTLLSLPKFEWYGILVLEHEADWGFKGEGYRLLRRLEFGETSVSFLFRERPGGPADGKKGLGDE
jgi:16S rRNA G966 N2-methylase RsmD